MDWKAKTGTDMLTGIVALLLALAELADRAAASPCKVRHRVLGFLHHAEMVAHASLYDLAHDLGAPALPQRAPVASPIVGDAPSDAELAAQRLRALALLWIGLLTWLQRVGRRTRKGLNTLAATLLRKVADVLPLPTVAPPRIDTS